MVKIQARNQTAWSASRSLCNLSKLLGMIMVPISQFV